MFTAADSAATDPYLEGIFRDWPALEQASRTEDGAEADRRAELSKWLGERELSMTRLTWADHDMPRLVLPPPATSRPATLPRRPRVSSASPGGLLPNDLVRDKASGA